MSRYDVIYTRYEGRNGSSGTQDRDDTSDRDEDEIADLIDEFLRYEYAEGDTCNESEDGYRSRSFSNSTVTGDEAFAYYMSDYPLRHESSGGGVRRGRAGPG